MLPQALLPQHATIAIATPASPPRDLAAYEAGIAYLAGLGFSVKHAPLPPPHHRYLNGTDEQRAAAFNALLSDPDIDAIFCTRGGYGTSRMLSLLDYEAARISPKLLVGYSDITALQLALYKEAAWRSLSGPMVAVEWGTLDPRCEEQFWTIATATEAFTLANVTGDPLLCMHAGEHTGPLLGGNLAVLTRLVGTPYLPNLQGAVLFLEDVNEPAYKVDAMLSQLKLSGIWENLGGLILGAFTDDDHPESTPAEIDEVFRDYCKNVDFPVASGLRYGHIPVKNAMPVGVEARLRVTPTQTELQILEPLVTHNNRTSANRT